MQLSILSGVYADAGTELRTSIPRNMTPVPKDSGVSAGYMKTSDGIVKLGDIAGKPRGSIVWRDSLYAVYDDKLYKISSDGSSTSLGTVVGSNPVRMTYGFDYLAIVTTDHRFYLFDGSTLAENTDSDLGNVFDVIWIDSYFMLTDGEYIIVTELGDPFSIDPLKYGSAESDPDDLVGVEKLRNEAYAVGRYTIEVFDNVGGTAFPFQRIDGARIGKGCVGTNAKCNFADEAIAFVGSGRNESPSVYFAANGGASRVATREIDEILLDYSELELSRIVVRPVIDKGHQWLMIYLPDRCLVYDRAASQVLQKPIWFELSSGVERTAYRGTFPAFAYGKWHLFDTDLIGTWSNTVHSHFGDYVKWEFGTNFLYNESRGAIIHDMELVSIVGNGAGTLSANANFQIETSYTYDGRTWSQPRMCSPGKPGQTRKRLRWLKQGKMDNYRAQRFSGSSDTPIAAMRLELKLEPLNA